MARLCIKGDIFPCDLISWFVSFAGVSLSKTLAVSNDLDDGKREPNVECQGRERRKGRTNNITYVTAVLGWVIARVQLMFLAIKILARSQVWYKGQKKTKTKRERPI